MGAIPRNIIPQGPSAPGYVQGTADTVKIGSGSSGIPAQSIASSPGVKGGNPAPQGQVLGASTGPTSGGSNIAASNITSPQHQQWIDQQAAQTTGNNNNNGINIDSIYNAAIQNLNGLQNTFNSDYQNQLSALNTNQQGQRQTVTDQQKQLQTQLAGQQTDFGNQMQSAYGQAARNFQDMQQAYANLYGGNAGGAGQFADQIAQQAYAQAYGQIGAAGVNANSQFNTEGQAINTWGDTQNNNITGWYQDAQNSLYNGLQQGLMQITNNANMLEADKASAKVDLLQQAIQQQSAIQDYATQLQGQMLAYQQLNGNGATVNPLDQSQYMSAINQASSALQQAPGQLNLQGQFNAAANNTGNNGYTNNGSVQDQYAQLINGGSAQATLPQLVTPGQATQK